MAEDKQGKPTGKAPDTPAAGDGPGKLGVDDRGNVTWEWTDDEELLADDTLGAAERVRVLVDPRLKVQDDDEPADSPIRSNPKGLKVGYDPYSSGVLAKQGWKKKKDLRELSKWIELRKKTAEKKEEPEE
jgi:hypothetical protein